MRQIIITFILLTLIATTVSAKIYKWRDENGKLQFSDKPPATGETAQAINVTNNGTVEGRGSKSRGPYAQPAGQPRQKITAQKKPTLRTITADDYNIRKSVHQKRDGTVEISGRINSGPACAHMRVNIFARSSDGGIVNITDTTSYNGFGSTLFGGSQQYRTYKKDWFISSLYIDCSN